MKQKKKTKVFLLVLFWFFYDFRATLCCPVWMCI